MSVSTWLQCTTLVVCCLSISIYSFVWFLYRSPRPSKWGRIPSSTLVLWLCFLCRKFNPHWFPFLLTSLALLEVKLVPAHCVVLVHKFGMWHFADMMCSVGCVVCNVCCEACNVQCNMLTAHWFIKARFMFMVQTQFSPTRPHWAKLVIESPCPFVWPGRGPCLAETVWAGSRERFLVLFGNG